MKHKKTENRETMSTGELLGRLKKSYAEKEKAASAKKSAGSAAQDVVTDDELDIAELLRKYLPDHEEKEKTAPIDDELELIPDVEAITGSLPVVEQAGAAEPAQEEPASDEVDSTATERLLDALRLPEEEAVSEPVSRSDSFESLLFELADDALVGGERETAESDVQLDADDAADPLLRDDPMADAVIAPAPVSELEPVPAVRKYVYHFRPCTKYAKATTVKVQETVPTPEPVEMPEPEAVHNAYFTNHGKAEFAYDDEPVIPDASAFTDVIPPLYSKPEETSADVVSDKSGDESAEAVNGEPGTDGETATLDETDINLMIALGYENELEQTVGIDRVREVEKQNGEEEDGENTQESAAFRGFEYTEKSQAKEIIENYKNEYSGIMLRLFGSLVLLAALFLYENISLFGVALPGALNMLQFPAVHALISLQLLVLIAALSWRQLFEGLRGVLTFRPTPQSLTAVAVLVCVVYDLIMAALAPKTGLMLYNFPAALSLVLLVLYDLMNLKREFCSFTVLADRREKYAVRALTAYHAEDETEDLTLDIRRVSFVDRYFARTNRKSSGSRRLNLVLLPVLALSAALSIIKFSMADSGLEALNIFVLTVLFCLPVSMLIVSSYPLFRAAQLAKEQDSAIIGEASVEEYSGADVVSFADRDIFPAYSVKLRSIKLYGNSRPDHVLFAATSVFSKVGGPLADVLELATKEFDQANEVELRQITETGIEASVDGMEVLVGREEFLSAYDIYPLHDAEDDANLAGGARILYIALDGTLCAKLYIQYEMDFDFEFSLRELARENVAVRIRTYDPNIDDDLLALKLRGKRYDIHVEKQLEIPTQPDPMDVMDSGLVALGSAKALVHSAIMCSRLTHVGHTGGIITAISFVVSLIIMLFLTIFGTTGAISSLYVALYQVFWMIPALIITRLFIK